MTAESRIRGNKIKRGRDSQTDKIRPLNCKQTDIAPGNRESTTTTRLSGTREERWEEEEEERGIKEGDVGEGGREGEKVGEVRQWWERGRKGKERGGKEVEVRRELERGRKDEESRKGKGRSGKKGRELEKNQSEVYAHHLLERQYQSW